MCYQRYLGLPRSPYPFLVYQDRSLPYRRGYLFHGPPGTGKSSLCLGIASLVHLNIFTVSLRANGLDGNGLTLLFQSLPKRCIVLFEDVDQAGLPRRATDNTGREAREDTHGHNHNNQQDGVIESEDDKETPNGISLSTFRNLIDGVSAQEGCILIMTTNAIQQLDNALLRPGRVDMDVQLGRADCLFGGSRNTSHVLHATCRRSRPFRSGKQCVSLVRQAAGAFRYRLRSRSFDIPDRRFTSRVRVSRPSLHLSKIVHALSVRHWSRSKHSEQREWVGFSYIIEVSESEERKVSAGFGHVSRRASQVGKIELNPIEHENFVWATEAEVRTGK
ncbi:P-loop containing nucleoside triphosphate hydrolase protein [Aspergillus ambiguus]|uniref:P-loop containing nucleoside triphosphate hydrolase protein n=1 Tax=Aspergillus ambiguus TaxID=176160 RepID=UPI003CCD4AA2